MHESEFHAANSFLTLTLSQENLPDDGSLSKRTLQLGLKRIRKACGSFRYLACGEYGDRFGRPHYHACVFGLDWRGDRRPHPSRGDYQLYRSERLERAWGLGMVVIGDLTFESAAYVARYTTKKRTGPRSDEAYERAVDIHTGEVLSVEREFALMSRKPGLGRKWFDRWANDVYPRDQVVVRGRLSRPPRYYDRLMSVERPEVMEEVKSRRVEERRDEESWERMRVMERVEWARLSQYAREIE